MDERVGEFTNDTRMIFNIGFYTFGAFVIWDESNRLKFLEKWLFRFWCITCFGYWSLSEIIHKFITPLEMYDSSWFILVPIAIIVLIDYIRRKKTCITL